MTHYSLLVSLHVASVIVWLGSGTSVVVLALYTRRNGVVLEQLGSFVQWMAVRVFAPASLAAFFFGAAAAHEGHWPHLFWFQVGEAAFGFSFLLTLVVRLPLLRRARRGAVGAARLAQYLLALAVAELTVLYLTVGDMVIKPAGTGTNAFRYGLAIVAVGFLTAAVIAYRAPRGGAATVAPIDLPAPERKAA